MYDVHAGVQAANAVVADHQRCGVGIPQVAALGGAATMYPDFRKTIKDQFVRPEKCTVTCAPGGGNQLSLFQPVPPFPPTMFPPVPSALEPRKR